MITNHAEEHDSLLGNPEHDDVAMVKFNCDTAPVDKPAEENSVKCTCTPVRNLWHMKHNKTWNICKMYLFQYIL